MKIDPAVHQQGYGQNTPFSVNWPDPTSGMPNPWLNQATPDAIIPRVDILDTGSAIIYVYDLCGADGNRINLEVSASEVALTAPMAALTKYPDAAYIYQERQKGTYTRLLKPPANVDLDNLTADFENGILTLSFPKKALKT